MALSNVFSNDVTGLRDIMELSTLHSSKFSRLWDINGSEYSKGQ